MYLRVVNHWLTAEFLNVWKSTIILIGCTTDFAENSDRKILYILGFRVEKISMDSFLLGSSQFWDILHNTRLSWDVTVISKVHERSVGAVMGEWFGLTSLGVRSHCVSTPFRAHAEIIRGPSRRVITRIEMGTIVSHYQNLTYTWKSQKTLTLVHNILKKSF